jgi:hypothetical protein
VSLQDTQVRGAVTFEEAYEDLHHRCEAIRADELLNTPIRGQPQKALISTHEKKQNKEMDSAAVEVELALCLEKECLEMIKIYLPLCGLHYHQCISGKCPEVSLKENYGIAKFNSKTQKIDYPAAVPKYRFPLPVSARPRKGLMTIPRRERIGDDVGSLGLGMDLSLTVSSIVPGEIKLLACKRPATVSKFYVDSEAGQCLSSCSTAFMSLQPCHIEVIGIAGKLLIFGIGTAVFALKLLDGTEILVRIYNCLYSFGGEFNLLSVSQIGTISQNTLDLALRAPKIRLHGSNTISGNDRKEFADLPLVLDDGLFALDLELVSSDDRRFLTSQIFDITPPGEYFPVSQASVGTDDQGQVIHQMRTTVVMPSASAAGRI